MIYDPCANAIVRWQEKTGDPENLRRDAERTFPCLADAARFVAEELQSDVRISASIEIGDEGLTSPEVMFYYRSITSDR
jgi:hypothetical protein